MLEMTSPFIKSSPNSMNKLQQLEVDKEQADNRQSPSAKAIHDSILLEAQAELIRPSSSLFWSGLAAGMSMGFSMITMGLLEAYLPNEEWSILVSRFGYSMGFLIVILGKQQLFTENTLTPILPLLRQRSIRMLLNVGRLWGVVLGANLLGALIVALVSAHTSAFSPEIFAEFIKIGKEAIEPAFTTHIIRGIFAGWLIALMVWLMPYAETARVWVIVIVTYVVSLGHFSHVIAGSVETFTLAASGIYSWFEVVFQFVLPTLVGNIIGGVVLVAALNHAQIKAG
jgi:formate-nitrite transporter family protein